MNIYNNDGMGTINRREFQEAFGECMRNLEKNNPRAAKVAQLCFIKEYTEPETAKTLMLSRDQVAHAKKQARMHLCTNLGDFVGTL